jgi:hypothetical protein
MVKLFEVWARASAAVLGVVVVGAGSPPSFGATLQDSDDWLCNHGPPGPRKDAACRRLRTDEPEYVTPRAHQAPPPKPKPKPVKPPSAHPVAPKPPGAPAPQTTRTPSNAKATLQRSVACLTYQAEAEKISGYVRANPGSFDRVLALAVADAPRLNGAAYLGAATPDRAVRGLARAGFAWRKPDKFSDYAYDVCKRGGLL